MYKEHPITQASFAVIDAEVGSHPFSPEEYAIIRRVVHSTADFDYCSLVTMTDLAPAIAAIQQGAPIITDVTMVAQGIAGVVKRTFNNPVIAAVAQATQALPQKTLTETGLLTCCQRYPQGLYIVGNAPTALLALCRQIEQGLVQPALVVGAPVGFIQVLEAKQALAHLDIPQIRVSGRKGGSGVAAAITNALLILAWNQRSQNH